MVLLLEIKVEKVGFFSNKNHFWFPKEPLSEQLLKNIIF